jgi:hypothetical protein
MNKKNISLSKLIESSLSLQGGMDHFVDPKTEGPENEQEEMIEFIRKAPIDSVKSGAIIGALQNRFGIDHHDAYKFVKQFGDMSMRPDFDRTTIGGGKIEFDNNVEPDYVPGSGKTASFHVDEENPTMDPEARRIRWHGYGNRGDKQKMVPTTY